jgi:hypothetical protein
MMIKKELESCITAYKCPVKPLILHKSLSPCPVVVIGQEIVIHITPSNSSDMLGNRVLTPSIAKEFPKF